MAYWSPQRVQARERRSVRGDEALEGGVACMVRVGVRVGVWGGGGAIGPGLGLGLGLRFRARAIG